MLEGYFAIPCEVVAGSCVRLGITKHLSNVQLGFLRGVRSGGERGQQEGLLSSHSNVSQSLVFLMHSLLALIGICL